MLCCVIGSSLVGVYTTFKTSLVANFKDGCENDMLVANISTLFARGVLKWSSLLSNLKPLDTKLNLQRTLA